MFGWLSSLIFGAIAYKSLSDDKLEERKRRKESKLDNIGYYIDINGRIRHTESNKKFTIEEIHNRFYNLKEERRKYIKNSYNKWSNPLIQSQKLDPDWYTFYDYVIDRFRNDTVTGKEIFPEINWDNIPPSKSFLKPHEYVYIITDFNSNCPAITSLVFDTYNNAQEYCNMYFDGKIYPVIRSICKDKVMTGSNVQIDNVAHIFIIYKTGETIYQNETEWENTKKI